jgi:hypothetical protein
MGTEGHIKGIVGTSWINHKANKKTRESAGAVAVTAQILSNGVQLLWKLVNHCFENKHGML